MNCKISGKQINLGESLTEHARTTLSSVVQRYCGEKAEISVTISKDNGVYSTDIYIHLPKNVTINSSSEDQDPYLCVDDASRKISRQLQRIKGTAYSKRNKVSEFLFNTEEISVDKLENSEEKSPITIAEVKDNIPSMSIKEATDKLMKSFDPFLIFKNNNKINIIFWKKDGNIGWVES